MRKKLLSLLLAGIMTAGMLTGCGETAEKLSEAESKTEESSKNAEMNKESNSAVEEEKEIVSLSFYSGFSGSQLDDADWFCNILRDEVGVEFEVAAGNADESVMLALLASGELTDIVGIRGPEKYVPAVEGDMLINLEDYKDQLPNIFGNERLAPALQNVKNKYEFDGIYGIPTRIGEQQGLSYEPELRWDLYEELGCPEMETPEDFMNVLAEMQKLQPVSADGKDVYAFQLWKNDNPSGYLGFMDSIWMVHNGWSYYGSNMTCISVDCKEEPVYIMDEDSMYMKGLRYLFEANQRGLIDPESAVQTWADMEAKMNSGAGLYSPLGWYDYGDEEAEDPVGFATVFPAFFRSHLNANQTTGYQWYFGISSSCKNIDAALAFLNWYYDEENQDLIYNGPEGLLYEVIDGQRVPTEAYKENGSKVVHPEGGTVDNVRSFFNAMMYNYTGTELETGYYNRMTDDPAFKQEEPTALKKEWQAAIGNYNSALEYGLDKGTVVQFSEVFNFTRSVPDDMQQTINQIGNVITAPQWEAIFAEDEEEFNQIIEQIRQDMSDLGVEEIVAYDIESYHMAIEAAAEYGITLE